MSTHTATNNDFVDTSKSISFTLGSPTDAAELRWLGLKTPWAQRDYLFNQAVPALFITKHWSTFSADFRTVCICKQRLNLPWLSTIWKPLSIAYKRLCLEHQKMTTEFLSEHIPWGKREFYFIICRHQILDPVYANSIIGVCDSTTTMIMLRQQTIPIRELRRWSRLALHQTCNKDDVIKILKTKPMEGFDFSEVPLDELSKYLTHDVEGIREGAAIRFDQLTNEGVL